MNNKIPRLVLGGICAGLVLFRGPSGAAFQSSGAMLALSFPHVGLSDDEWVGSYGCRLLGFDIVAIREIPYVWYTDVANEKAGRASIDAGHWLGTGPMGKDPINDLQRIVVLRRVPNGKKHDSPTVSCKLSVENFHSDDIRFTALDTAHVSIKRIDTLPSAEPPHESSLKRFALSFPAFVLADNERIVMFEVELKSARVVSVHNIPDLWSLDATNNDAASFTGVYGEALADSAALRKDDFAMFDRFVTIEPQGDFEIRVKLKIRTAPKHYRYVRFDTKQLILSPVSYSGRGTR
jgi:hypothetical protein